METSVVKVAPSILAADFARLGEQVAEAEDAGADRIHVDVMDGHFVPNLSMGAPMVASLRRVTRLSLEIHMMVSAPNLFLEEFVDAGADSFLVHWEGNANLHRTVRRIRTLGKRPGVAINPATPAAVLEEILQDVEQVLVMTVDPGFGHQQFLHTTLPKIRRVRRMIEQIKAECDLEVDGGIDPATAPLAVAAGANVLVFSHTGSWQWNARTGEVAWSKEFFSIFGFDPQTTKASYALYLARIHPEDRSKVEEVRWAALREKRDYDAQYRILLPGGLIKYLHSIGHCLVNQSGDIEYLGAIVDITERKRAEEEHERLRQAQADLARMNRVSTMGELTASLAHEVKQPISAARTNARTCLRWLARDQPDLIEAREAASRLIKDVTRASDIIRRVGALFKKDVLQRELVNVNDLIREMILLLQSEAARYSIWIHGTLANDLPEIMADRVELQQVLMNLMLNGIEAMKGTSTPGKLTITSQQDDSGQLLVSVADIGVGLKPGQAEQVFKPFFTSKSQGTGMGLPISRSIIESHGGRLWATPNSGPGTTFQFTLPVETQAKKAA